MLIDLHSHTTCSDGRNPPAELVRLARAAGIDVLAVTDHDTTAGIREAVREGKRVGVRVVPGIEISSRLGTEDVHILGIGIDASNRALQTRLTAMRRARKTRVRKICAALAGLGLKLDPADVLAEAGGKSVGRKHVARAMVKRGLVESEREAFDRYLGSGGPANVAPTELEPSAASRLIRGAGGIPILAHPHFFGNDRVVEAILDASAVRGIEAYHRYERPRKYLAYLAMARERNLLVTGGSDYHGDDHPHNAGMGEFLTPPDQWAAMERRLRV